MTSIAPTRDVEPRRIVVYGNSGSGKTTMARALAEESSLPHLDLDLLAWDAPGIRRDTARSVAETREFVEANPSWVIEGCYADLIEAVLPYCTELRFLNPGVESCIANCRARPWEPSKYPSKAAQDEKLEFLLGWVRAYETRDDEFSLLRHRRLFEGFTGRKREYTTSPPTDRHGR